MKALKLLKELKHTMNTVELFRFVVNYDKLEKAIEELEHLSGSKQLVDNHKTCEGCKYYTYDDNKENCFIIDACVKNEVTLTDNFYCSEWESKE